LPERLTHDLILHGATGHVQFERPDKAQS